MRYLLDLAPQDEGGIYAQLTGRLLDRTGAPLKSLEFPIAQHEIRRGLDIRDVDAGYVRAEDGDRLADCLWYSVGTNPAFSKAAVQAFDDESILIDENVYRWPLHVYVDQIENIVASYYVMWAMSVRPVVDLQKSDVRYYKNTTTISEIRTYVLDESVASRFDLFKTNVHEWIVSERFRDVVRAHGFSGFRFPTLP